MFSWCALCVLRAGTIPVLQVIRHRAHNPPGNFHEGQKKAVLARGSPSGYRELMTQEVQTAVALGIVGLTAAFFLRRWWKARKNPGCGGGCGCSGAKKFGS